MTTITTSPDLARTRQGKYVYFFGGGKADGNADMKNLLGGKGAGLAEMTNIGIPVPPGFTITTEVCTAFYENGRQLPRRARASRCARASPSSRASLGRKFGDADAPAARLGALRRPRLDARHDGHRPQPRPQRRRRRRPGRASPATARFAYDSYRRFVQMYGDVVLGLKPEGKEERPLRGHPRGQEGRPRRPSSTPS